MVNYRERLSHYFWPATSGREDEPNYDLPSEPSCDGDLRQAPTSSRKSFEPLRKLSQKLLMEKVYKGDILKRRIRCLKIVLFMMCLIFVIEAVLIASFWDELSAGFKDSGEKSEGKESKTTIKPDENTHCKMYKSSVLSYVGEWEDGVIQGYGHMTWHKSLDEYFGQFKENKLDGWGSFLARNGDMYLGHYKKQHKDGLGIYQKSNGDLYVGYWSNGRKNGLGWTVRNGQICKVDFDEGTELKSHTDCH